MTDGDGTSCAAHVATLAEAWDAGIGRYLTQQTTSEMTAYMGVFVFVHARLM